MCETKICIKCNKEKNITEFNKVKQNKSGYNNICKLCQKIAYKLYYEKNIEKRREYSKNWNKNNFERKKESHKIWRKNNPDKIKERNIKYYLKNKDKIVETNNNWRKNNKEKVNEAQRRRYHLNIEKYREKNRIIMKKLYDINPEKFKEKSKNWRKDNIQYVKKYNFKYKQIQCKKLSDVYIRHRLHTIKFPKKLINEEIITLERGLIKNKRILKQIKIKQNE